MQRIEKKKDETCPPLSDKAAPAQKVLFVFCFILFCNFSPEIALRASGTFF
jgi:hypothetical protein